MAHRTTFSPNSPPHCCLAEPRIGDADVTCLPHPCGHRRRARLRRARAPVAQWIERCPPEAEVAGSNPAGRAEEAPPGQQLIDGSRRVALHTGGAMAGPTEWRGDRGLGLDDPTDGVTGGTPRSPTHTLRIVHLL